MFAGDAFFCFGRLWRGLVNVGRIEIRDLARNWWYGDDNNYNR